MKTGGYVFVDGLGHVSLVNGMVRLEFVAASASARDAEGKSVLEPSQTLVMTPQGFMQIFSNMEKMMERMVEAGMVVDPGKERRAGPARTKSNVVADKKGA
ncbi:MAG: hypothetical protein HQL63_13875 [Magnetococcales bacterium]|nr:hypothetical protein [Magnetococcales bacterium]